MVMGSGFFDDYEESGDFKYPGGIPTEEDNPKNKKNGGKKVADNENERIQNTSSSNPDDDKEKKKNGEGKGQSNPEVLSDQNKDQIDKTNARTGIEVKELSDSSGTSSGGEYFDPNTAPYSELLKRIPEEFQRKNPDGQVMGHAANYNPFMRSKESPHGRFYDPETKTSYALDADLKPDMTKPVFGSTGNYDPEPPSGSEMLTSVADANQGMSFTLPGDDEGDGDFEYCLLYSSPSPRD